VTVGLSGLETCPVSVGRPLALGEEARAIQAELERSGYRD